jgi:hypothetical protein
MEGVLPNFNIDNLPFDTEKSVYDDFQFSMNDIKWDNLDNLLASTPMEPNPADSRISVFDRFDLNNIQDHQLFNINGTDDRFSFYMPKMSPPKGIPTSKVSLIIMKLMCRISSVTRRIGHTILWLLRVLL